MQRYYCDNWSETVPFFLSEEESRHCVSVMRNGLGAHISLLDGKGSLIQARVIEPNPKHCGLQFEKVLKKEEKRNPLHIAISPTKSNDRIEWFIEKACEIGIGQITPLLCERTERNKVNLERWKKIVISSCKQSSLLYFPQINELTKLHKFLEKYETKTNNTLVASIGVESKMSDFKLEKPIFIIGPEGDFSESEFDLIREKKLQEVNLSNNILRVETAGVVAVSQWNQIYEG